ncbi:hypothetical protein BGZ68_007198, partial [Mortierella alpina]
EDAFENLEEKEVNDEENEEDEECIQKRLIALAAKRVHAQIGRLEKLEIVALDIDSGKDTRAEESDYAWDLTLPKGWLCELAGLKNQRRLILQSDFLSRMSQAEVEFLH